MYYYVLLALCTTGSVGHTHIHRSTRSLGLGVHYCPCSFKLLPAVRCLRNDHTASVPAHASPCGAQTRSGSLHLVQARPAGPAAREHVRGLPAGRLVVPHTYICQADRALAYPDYLLVHTVQQMFAVLGSSPTRALHPLRLCIFCHRRFPRVVH